MKLLQLSLEHDEMYIVVQSCIVITVRDFEVTQPSRSIHAPSVQFHSHSFLFVK